MITPALVRLVLAEYALDPMGIHGVPHWARVRKNGRTIGPPSGADPVVVELFALFHDARRWNDGRDPAHGRRGGELALAMRESLPGVTDAQLDLLQVACAYHTHRRTHPDVTVQVCWDSDRLDLARVGIQPDPHFLNTAAAKDPKILRAATARGEDFVVLPEVAEWLGD